MTVAELFVNLGVKGADKSAKAIVGVKNALSETKSMSLETKAAILAVVYGLEQLTTKAATRGLELNKFSEATGLSANQLQRWQYAARQFGVGAEEVQSSIQGVQTAMTNMLLKGQAPEGLNVLANTVGFDTKKARDAFYVMEKLQQFSKQVPRDVGNAVMASFGLSPNMIQMMRQNSIDLQKIKPSNILGEGEINQLSKTSIAWTNLGAMVELAMAHFTSRHGLELVGNLTKLTTEVLKLAEALTVLAEKSKVFDTMSKTVAGITKLSQELSKAKGFGDFFKNIEQDEIKKSYDQQEEMVKDLIKRGKMPESALDEFHKERKPYNLEMYLDKRNPSAAEGLTRLQQGIRPDVKPQPFYQQPSIQNINIDQTLQFQHDGKDHQKIQDTHKKAVKGAFYQLSSQSQVT